MTKNSMSENVGNPNVKLPQQVLFQFIHWKELTLKGIGFIFFGLGLYALLLFIYFLIQISFLIPGIQPFRAGIIFTFPFVGLLAFVVIIYGIGRMLKGRRGFGPIHSQKVYFGMIFFMLFFISFASFLILQIIYFMFGSPRLGVIYTLIFTSLLLVSVLFLELSFVFLIIELIPRELKTFLYITGVVWVAGPIIHHLTILLQPGLLTPIFFISPLSPSIIIGVVMMLFCYRKTYLFVKQKQIVPYPPPLLPIMPSQSITQAKTSILK